LSFKPLIVFCLCSFLIGCASLPVNDASISQLKRMADRGNTEAQFRLGNIHAKIEDIECIPESGPNAVKYWEMAANQGHAKAAAQLGRIYEIWSFYTSSPDDPEMAAKWYRKGIELGDPNARKSLERLLDKHPGLSDN
jgi:TPR repeat protein